MKSDAEIVHEHQYTGTLNYGAAPWQDRGPIEVTCSCGHREPTAWRQGRKTHSAHVAAMLRENRTITDSVDLDALPDGTVVIDDAGEVMEADTATTRNQRIWFVIGREWEYDDSDHTHLPARVLWHPELDGGDQ